MVYRKKPPIGYHTLKLLDALRQSYNGAEKEIRRVQENKRLGNDKKIERIQNLRAWQKEIKSEFEFWAELVQEWVSKFNDEDILYGDVILEYYCKFHNVSPLYYVLEDILCEDEDKNKDSQNFQSKIRQLVLNYIMKM